MPAKFAPKPPLEKLPLAVRKDIRDEYDSKKDQLEAKIAELLGDKLTFDFNANEIWAYAEESGCSAAGYTLNAYAEGFVYALERYVETYGAVGREYFTKAVTKKKVFVAVNEAGPSASYISADVKDGVFRILFRHDSLGSNSSYLSDSLVDAIENARIDNASFTLLAQHSIDNKYSVEIDVVRQNIANILDLPDVILDPNFAANYGALKAKEDSDWKRTFGNAALEYFQGVQYQLERQGFKGDKLLQEGFKEGVPSKTIRIRVTDGAKGYLESVLVDGAIEIQMKPDNWYVNASDAGAEILGLL